MILDRIKILFFIIIFTLGCQDAESPTVNKIKEVGSIVKPEKVIEFKAVSREVSFARLQKKIINKKPLFVHILVPLCDNDNQGIVPVSSKLGNGFDLKNNLYWGAKYGVKSYFKNSSKWKLLHSQKNINKNVLERIVLKQKNTNASDIYIIADAYRGDKMKNCLDDFFGGLSGRQSDSLLVDQDKIYLYKNADLMIFNGHNGLMDVSVAYHELTDQIQREAMVIGCYSFEYFEEHFKATRSFPVLTTTHLLAPEAYVLEAAIESWSKGEEGSEIRASAGKAYHKFQKCGLKGATKLFKTGW